MDGGGRLQIMKQRVRSKVFLHSQWLKSHDIINHLYRTRNVHVKDKQIEGSVMGLHFKGRGKVKGT